MKHRAFVTLAAALVAPLALAQNGDRKGHDKMADIVPEELIPDAPVLSVEDALKAFTIHNDFIIEAVVAEPLVDKPVALSFDGQGRMWVVEMRGYMPNIDGKDEDKPVGRIAILEDTTGDGKVDKRTLFLDKILLPRTIALVSGGVLYGDQEQLYFIERDGDKPKGEAIVVDNNYSRGSNVEHKPNGMMLGMDNWMYNSKSSARYQWNDGELTKEPTSARGQWGITKDDAGRLFYNSNSTLLIGDRVLPNLLFGNQTVKMKTRIDTRVSSNEVHPGRVNPGLNRAYISTLNGYKDNTISPKDFKLIKATGACGPVIYRGNQFPAEFHGWSFVCESAAQMVKAIKVETGDNEVSGSHPLGDKEFLTSTDERFRPVNLYTAPDGSLYLLDMYHGIIQHKTYMTSYLRRQTLSRGLEGPGFGHGRIYRIRAKDRPLEKMVNLEKVDAKTLAATLLSENGTQRDLAQKEIIDRKLTDAAPFLRKLIAGDFSNVAKMHALWTLEGLDALTAADIKPVLSGSDEDLISSALYAALSLNEADLNSLTSDVVSVKNDDALLPYKSRALAASSSTDAHQALVTLLKKNGKKPFVREAAIAGMSKTAGTFAAVNAGNYKEKNFDEWVKKSLTGPIKEIDPMTLLKGEHQASHKRGKELYMGRAACIACHGPDGAGLPNLGPILDNSDWVRGDHERLTKILLHGLQGPIIVNGKKFTPQAFMPGLAQNPTITDQDLADLMTFLRSGWSNRSPLVTKDQVVKIREATKERNGQMYSQEDFTE
ncbi:c-type cytochrome [Akkermansiaceae bacterium]|nr:c-type cytochrome [Akkermansiaceae bacterium]MDB4406701.1 c-type cytochrome [Akkermansiaceae bacterium]MDB4554427.1 c-type cytochrome [Akkermansiaceae bacterium]MDC1206543.1 c-type cytochrome [Akkermansiaceae bacterium]